MQNTRQIVTAIRTALEGLTYLDPAVDVFEKVDVYDVDHIQRALQDLILTQRRIGLIVPGREYDQIPRGQSGLIRASRYQSFMLVILSRDYAPGKSSLFDDGGAYDMKEAVTDAFRANPSLGLNSCFMQPAEGMSVRLVDKEVPDGREGWVLYYDVFLGQYELAVPVGAVSS